MHRHRKRGFTLLEVLVAMAILSISALALLNAARNELSSVDSLRERTLAWLVAQNRLTEWQLGGEVPDNGSSDQDVHLGGQVWTARSSFAPTPAPSVRRVDVSVGPKADFLGTFQPELTLTGYVHLLAQGGANVASP